MGGRRAPGRWSLPETATLDPGLAQQLPVLLLGHPLAALLDHRAHTTCLLEPMCWLTAESRLAAQGPSPLIGPMRFPERPPAGTCGRRAPVPGTTGRPVPRSAHLSAPSGTRSSWTPA